MSRDRKCVFGEELKKHAFEYDVALQDTEFLLVGGV
jgi:hypothetical protein